MMKNLVGDLDVICVVLLIFALILFLVLKRELKKNREFQMRVETLGYKYIGYDMEFEHSLSTESHK
ncbi:hypothetical protein QO059_08595 [Fervidobacterium islandicum]|uniref:hypothetical protein n=1 Tax=Fervidobacterium islandicum TaxID=2423 RepID=UPI003A63BB86